MAFDPADPPGGPPHPGALQGIACWIVAGLALVATPTAAQDAGLIRISDPLGDAQIDSAPLGPGGDLYDIQEATLAEADGGIELTITVAAAPQNHQSAEFTVVFRVDGTWYMGGYTSLPTTSPPFSYQGGFACPATEDGFVNGSVSDDCIGLDTWSRQGTTYAVVVPLAFLNATAGSEIRDVWAYSEISPYLKGTARADTTSREGLLRLGATPASPDPAAPKDDRPDERAVPAPGPPLVVALCLLVAAFRHARRGHPSA